MLRSGFGLSEPKPSKALADELYIPPAGRQFRQLPALAVGAIRMVWAAARGPLLISLTLQLTGAVLLAVQVLAARFLLTRILAATNSGDFHPVVPWLVVIVVVFAATSLVAVLQLELQRLLGELVARYSMQKVVDAASVAELVDFEDPRFHDRLQRASVNASIRPYQMTTGLFSLGSTGVSSLAVAVTLATIEPWFLALVVAGLVPITLVSLSVGRALYRFSVEQTPNDRQRTYIQTLLTDKDTAKEVRAYDLAPFLGRRYTDLYELRIAALRALIRSRSVKGVGGALVTGVAVGGTAGLLVLFISDHRVSLAGAGAAAAALLLLGSQMQSMSAAVGSLYESALFISDFNQFVSVTRTPAPSDIGQPVAPAQVGKVKVDSVSFTYPSRTEPSLQDITITIEPDQVVALVGENGSGKTTLAKLLAGLYRPDTGAITWSGQNIHDLPSPSRRAAVAVLFQDFVRYFMAAADNVGLGDWRRAGNREAVIASARRADADRFLSALPHGYETLLGPQFFGGSDLSGGQWQRVALARAFFRDTALVILDEPTASLDPRAEADLFASVRELFAGRSVVLISHRFASVRLADRIYVLDAGRVTEEGTHEDLMAADGLYQKLFTLQASAFGLTREG